MVERVLKRNLGDDEKKEGRMVSPAFVPAELLTQSPGQWRPGEPSSGGCAWQPGWRWPGPGRWRR